MNCDCFKEIKNEEEKNIEIKDKDGNITYIKKDCKSSIEFVSRTKFHETKYHDVYKDMIAKSIHNNKKSNIPIYYCPVCGTKTNY